MIERWTKTIVTVWIISIILSIRLRFIESKQIYSKDNIEVYYMNTDSIYVINNNDYNIDINIDNSHNIIEATQGRKVTLVLNSDYDKIKINVDNKDTISISYIDKEY